MKNFAHSFYFFDVTLLALCKGMETGVCKKKV